MNLKKENISLESIVINTDDSKEDKISSYLHQNKNPFKYSCGDIGITIEFNTSSTSLEDILLKYLIHKKQSL